MKNLMKNCALIAVVSLTACTDANRAKIEAFGEPAQITCYSAGKEIYNGTSTGKIMMGDGGVNWSFNDAATNRLVRVSGDCVIKN